MTSIVDKVSHLIKLGEDRDRYTKRFDNLRNQIAEEIVNIRMKRFSQCIEIHPKIDQCILDELDTLEIEYNLEEKHDDYLVRLRIVSIGQFEGPKIITRQANSI